MKKTMFKDSVARLTAMDAVKHKWYTTYAFEAEDKRLIKNALLNFRNYT